MFSDKVKSVVQSRRGTASASLVFPLPAVEHNYAAAIELRRWLDLPIDRRAPVRSVALVEVVGERFLALVVDTVAARPRWLVEGDRTELSRLYEGMLGEDGGARRTLVISAPQLTRSLTPVKIAEEVLAIVIGFDQDDCDPPVIMAAVPSQDPGGGSPGVTVGSDLVVQAQVQSDLASGLSDAMQVQITDAHGGTQGALLVSTSALL